MARTRHTMTLFARRTAVLSACIAVLLAVGCTRTPTPDDAAIPDAAEDQAPAPVSTLPENAFAVTVTLTPVALQRLRAEGESIVVAADYFGYPTIAAQQRRVPGTEDPWLTLHTVEVTPDAAGVARFPSIAIDPARLALVEGGDVQVNVNVWSARRKVADNLLDCGLFQDTLEAAVRGPVEIDCKLIAE